MLCAPQHINKLNVLLCNVSDYIAGKKALATGNCSNANVAWHWHIQGSFAKTFTVAVVSGELIMVDSGVGVHTVRG